MHELLEAHYKKFQEKENLLSKNEKELDELSKRIETETNDEELHKLIMTRAHLITRMEHDVAEMRQMKSVYDAMVDTIDHIETVRNHMSLIIANLISRANDHDESKLQSPEIEVFAEYGPKLKTSTYMSAEYKQNLADMKPALDHHYANNSHHPQYYENGVDGMTLMDVVEMFADWKAAGERHEDGNILESIKQNTERFNLSPQLVNILTNTANQLYGSKTYTIQHDNVFNPDKVTE